MAAGAAAHADTTMISQDNFGILNGTQVFAPIQAPINLCGVAAAVSGMALAGCEGGSAASLTGLYDATMISKDNVGILNGLQVLTPVQIPANICGLAIAAIGQGFAGCEGGASATIGQDDHHRRKGVHHYEESESVPDGCGSSCTPPPATPTPQPPADHNPHDCPPGHGHGHHGYKGKHRKDGVTMVSAGNFGILNGTQIYAPVQAPVDVSGIALGVIGQGTASSVGGSSARK
jgi:hypothetical protein